MKQPERVFREDDLQAHVRRLRKGLPSFEGRQFEVLRYHALSAVAACQSRWRLDRQQLWISSRISELLAALERVAPEASRASVAVPRAIVDSTLQRLEEGVAGATDQANALLTGEQRALQQLRGVIDETRGRRAFADAAIGEHFMHAEVALFDAIGELDEKTYKMKVLAALQSDGLARVMEEILDGARRDVSEKFQEMADELDVLGVSFDQELSGLDEVWSQAQEQRRKADEAAKKTRRRRVIRSVVRAAMTPAIVAAGSFVAGGPGAAGGLQVAATAADVVDRLLPDVGGPDQDAAAQVREVRTLVENLKNSASTAFEEVLEEGILVPLEERLVPPHEAAIDGLSQFIHTSERYGRSLAASLAIASTAARPRSSE